MGVMLAVAGGVMSVIAFIVDKLVAIVRWKIDKWANMADPDDCKEERSAWEFYDTIVCLCSDIKSMTYSIQNEMSDMHIWAGILIVVGVAVAWWESRD